MSKAFSNLLKHLGKLNPTEHERVYHWLKCYVDPAYSVGGRLLDEMRETRFPEGTASILFGTVNGKVGSGSRKGLTPVALIRYL